jgi:cyclic pyranopterin phosphate synthase
MKPQQPLIPLRPVADIPPAPASASGIVPQSSDTTLQDTHGRRFSYLRLSVTDVCNFRCNYCLPDGYQCSDTPAPLRLDEIATLAQTFAALGTRKIRITGGEPSLRKDLPEIIRILKNTAGIEQVALTTNGYRLSKQIDDWIAARLDQLNVSIDSLDPQQFQAITGHDKLQEILNGIERARALGLTRIKVNAVLLKTFNESGLSQFLNWLKTTPVTLRFIELMQTGDNAGFFAAQHVRGEDIKQQLLQDGWQPKLRGSHDGPAQEFYHPHFSGQIGLIMPYSQDFCKSCNRLRISAQGKLHLCLFGEEGYELRPLLHHASADIQQHIRTLLGQKKESHYLQAGRTGAISHFAMIGG